MSDQPILQVILQRHDGDCGVACLAMLLGVSYEDALLAICTQVPNVLEVGLHPRHLKLAAKHLNHTLRERRHRYDLDTDSGLLRVEFDSHAHIVVLREGLIIETNGMIWDADTYFATTKAKHGPLLVRED